jgi:hypothetical protein
MRDTTYVVIALALCSLAMLALSMQKPKLWMLDLEDFKALPVELRSALRRMLPDPVTIRQRWAYMTPDQKRHAIQQIGGFIPQPRPSPPSVPLPMKTDTTAPEPVPDAPEPVPEAPVAVIESSLKKGFLDTVKKGKKKDAKHKKEDEVIALSAVGADVPANVGADGSFLGGDD